ncbi:MAG: UDP-glucose 4-epimerase GalE [Acidobacteriota bacterium]
MSVIVTGGAGYIGSHIVKRLVEMGEAPIVIDDLSEGHRDSIGECRLIIGDFSDPEVLGKAIADDDPPFIIHMAANSLVGESIVNPSKYYENNLIKSLRMLDFLREEKVKGIVFSSSAAVYGEPKEIPIKENHPQDPTNPYGETKLSFERALEWYRRSYSIGYVSLRYFNAAGADPDGTIGENHADETHLIPRLLLAILGRIESVEVFGDDYPTYDGTCIRDYIHVMDLAEAHILAMVFLERNRGAGRIFNLGNGEGFSVLEVIEMVKRVTGRDVPVKIGKRRQGDPAVLLASSAKIVEELRWKARFPSLADIIETAWKWHRAHPEGYKKK